MLDKLGPAEILISWLGATSIKPFQISIIGILSYLV